MIQHEQRRPARRALLARAALSLAATCALGSAARALAQIELAPDPTSSWHGLHGTTEALGKALALDLDRDGRQDLVLLTDARKLVWSKSPAERQHRRVVTLGGLAATIDDVALQLDGPGGGAALLSANPNGVHQWTYDPVGDELDAVTVRAQPGGHLLVACAREVAGIYRSAYALRADGRTVDPLLFHSTTGVEVFPLQSFELGAAAGRIEAFDLEGDGLAELAAVTQTSLVVRRLDGTLVASFQRSSPRDPSADALAVLQDAGSAADQLAWVVPEAAGSRLRVLSQAGLSGPLNLGAEAVLQLAAADLDRDGLADLALAPDLGPRVRVLRSVASGAPRFALVEPDDHEHLPSEWFLDQAQLASAGVALADFDRDGDVDVALGSKQSGATGSALALWRGLAADHERLHPVLREGSVSRDEPELYDVTLELDAPPEAVVADALRYRVWQQVPFEARAVGQEPVVEGVVPAPAGWPWTLALELAAEDDPQARWTVEVLLADEQGAEDVLHPSLLVAAAAEGIDQILFQAEPGLDLWGPWLGGGSAAIGEGGVGGVPRVPPPPIPPEPPEPPTPIP